MSIMDNNIARSMTLGPNLLRALSSEYQFCLMFVLLAWNSPLGECLLFLGHLVAVLSKLYICKISNYKLGSFSANSSQLTMFAAG